MASQDVHDLLAALNRTENPDTSEATLQAALDAARARGWEEAAEHVRPTATETASLPQPVAKALVERAQQLVGASVRVRAGKPPFGKARG